MLAKNFTSAYIGRLSWFGHPETRCLLSAPKKESDPRPPIADAAEYAGAGLQFAGAILLFLFVGRWLDGRLGTEPWLLLLGVFTGASAGFYTLYRQLVTTPRKREEERRRRAGGGTA